MRVIFMGTPEFAAASLRAIIAAGYDVPLVVSTPDRQKGRGLKLVPSEVKRLALELGLPVTTPESLKDPGFLDELRAAGADVICVVAFRILPEAVYTIPPLGSFNLHGSLLPRYRGAAPINRAIMNGETQTGVTTFFLQRTVDTGAIILQRPIAIGPEMTAGELHDVMKQVGAEAVVDTLRMIESGRATTTAQDDSLASPAPKIFRDDCRIDWSETEQRVFDRIRGLSPYPGAFTYYRGRQLKIYRAHRTERPGLAPGEVQVEGSEILVGTGGNALAIDTIQQEGARAMQAAEFVRGFRFDQGGRFENAATPE